MSAAVIAGLAFASLALSDLAAVGQLGILCGLGEVLTAVAILLVTPEIGAWLEKGPPPPERTPRWLGGVAALTRTPGRARAALAVAVFPVLLLVLFGWPSAGRALVALRPRGLAPLVTQDAIYDLFGGRPGQWIVLSIDRDPERARTRADDVAEALEVLGPGGSGSVEGYDSLSTWLPSATTQRRRLAMRDALDLPSRRADLSRALDEAGFDLEETAPALDAFAHPSADVVAGDVDPTSPLAAVVARHVGKDGGDTIVATYVRPTGDPKKDEAALARLHIADRDVVVTGYAHLETALKASLADDLPRVGLLALGVAAVGLALTFRRLRDVLLALGTVVLELAALGVAMRLFHVRWHVYDALVVPVLVGITLDESMFLLYAARAKGEGVEGALRAQGPLVAATALTTAAGFVALVACRFDGLFDLGATGTLGVLLGLVAALVVVPAGLRLAPRPTTGRTTPPPKSTPPRTSPRRSGR
jgi:predicted RND superfamily exporter protein